MHNFWREHRLILVDPNILRPFRLGVINQQQLLALYDAKECCFVTPLENLQLI